MSINFNTKGPNGGPGYKPLATATYGGVVQIVPHAAKKLQQDLNMTPEALLEQKALADNVKKYEMPWDTWVLENTPGGGYLHPKAFDPVKPNGDNPPQEQPAGNEPPADDTFQPAGPGANPTEAAPPPSTDFQPAGQVSNTRGKVDKTV